MANTAAPELYHFWFSADMDRKHPIWEDKGRRVSWSIAGQVYNLHTRGFTADGQPEPPEYYPDAVYVGSWRVASLSASKSILEYG